MDSELPAPAREVLDQGILCYLAAVSPAGPHVTPVVFVHHGGRLWSTTSRGSVKAKLWKRDSRVAGLVVTGTTAVTFRGTVRRFDALDPVTWPASVLRAPALARASTRFTLKNLRYFAGYARDARRVPFGWTPPGRVVVSVRPEAGAVITGNALGARWGDLVERAEGGSSFRRRATPALDLPAESGELLASPGPAVLGLLTDAGPSVLPVRWNHGDDGTAFAVLSRDVLALAGVDRATVPGALVVDRASNWRAADMRGLLLRGPADVFEVDHVGSGRRSLLEAIAAAGEPPLDPVVVRLRPARAVWWQGWSSGTVTR